MYDKSVTYKTLHFSEMDINAGTERLAIPVALEQQPVKDQEHITMPPTKDVFIRSLLDAEPEVIAAEPIDGKWLATTGQIQVNFANPALTMHILMNDWLLKPQSKDWQSRIADAPDCLVVSHTDATVFLRVEPDAHKYEQPYYELPGLVYLQALGQEIGLRYLVLNDVMHSCYRVWAPYRPKRVDSIIDGETSEGEA